MSFESVIRDGTSVGGVGVVAVSAIQNLSTSAGAAAVALPPAENTGFAALACEVDSGSNTGERTVREVDCSTDYRTRVGVDTLQFNEWFPGTVLNSSKWLYTAVTQTATVTAGFLNLNAGGSVATTTSVYCVSQAVFPIYGTFGIWAEFEAQFTQLPVTNNVVFLGLAATPGLIAAAADACGIRLSSTGNAEFVCISTTPGVDSVSVAIPNWSTLVGNNTVRHFAIFIGEDEAELWIDNVIAAKLTRPNGAGGLLVSGSAKVFMLNQNTGATSVAQIVKVGMVNVTQADEANTLPVNIRAALVGDMGYQAGTGSAVANTVNCNNSANPTAAVPTNTTAALGTGLGGQFWETRTLALTTDGIICAFLVPAAAAGITAKRLMVTGVSINSVVRSAITDGGLIEQWFVAFGHTAVSLATAEAAAAKAPRRKMLGCRPCAAAAVALTEFREIRADFGNAPICVNPGEYIAICKKNIGGTVESAGVVHHTIDIDAYWL